MKGFQETAMKQILVLATLFAVVPLLAQTPTLTDAAAARRARLLKVIPDGILVVQSADRDQSNLYQFMEAGTENHDFLYLTGIDKPRLPGSTLVLNPRGETYREILYTSDDVDAVKRATRIEHVLPLSRFTEDLSSAITDYRNLRITQLRFQPVASDLSRGLGLDGTRKVVYWNYPRFTNLNEPVNPRFALIGRLRDSSPEIEIRDASELLDRLRMIQDDYGLAQIRQAVQITGKGLMEGMKLSRPGVMTGQVKEMVDFVYRFNGGGFGFETNVSVTQAIPPAFASAREKGEPRSQAQTIGAGALVHIDTGATFNHYSADVQRVVPADGRFTDEQRRFYNTVLGVQKAVIESIRPGVRWQDLQALAVRMLRDAGGWDKSYTYGIGHFLGMEVHDHGDYLRPLEPGMVLTIEQGAIVNGVRVAFEDDVLVTVDGHEWLTQWIPIEAVDVERMMAEPRVFDPAKYVAPGPRPPR
jgi:Xaa-Pro aminopeptidase